MSEKNEGEPCKHLQIGIAGSIDRFQAEETGETIHWFFRCKIVCNDCGMELIPLGVPLAPTPHGHFPTFTPVGLIVPLMPKDQIELLQHQGEESRPEPPHPRIEVVGGGRPRFN